MKLTKFFDYAEEQWSIEKKLLENKGVEYTMSSDDKLENFKQVANLLDRVESKDVIMTYLLKHFFSIINYVNTGKSSSSENIFGRIQDARNYLLLLSARLKEEEKTPDEWLNVPVVSPFLPDDATVTTDATNLQETLVNE